MKKEYIKPSTDVRVITPLSMICDSIPKLGSSADDSDGQTKARNDFEDDLEEIGDSWGKNGFWNN